MHKWIMGFVGLQVLVWSLTGLYMVTMDIHFIHGESELSATKNVNRDQNLITPSEIHLSPNEIITQTQIAGEFHKHDSSSFEVLTALRLFKVNDQPIYEVSLKGKPKTYKNAQSGETLVELSKADVLQLVTTAVNNTNLENVKVLQNEVQYFGQSAPDEVSSRYLPMWKIPFGNLASTTVYINSLSGEIVTVRHDYWRLFDWMWRFHIMEYTTGENVDNILLRVITVLALIATISGLVLLYIKLIKPLFKGKKLPPFNILKSNSSLHKWLSAMVCVQLFIWVATGLFFNLMSFGDFTGNDNRKRTEYSLATVKNVKPLLAVEALNVKPFSQLSLVNIAGQLVYKISYTKNAHSKEQQNNHLLDVNTGKTVYLDKDMAQSIAMSSYKINDGISLTNKNELLSNVTYLEDVSFAFPGEQNPGWQVKLNDKTNTAIYVRHSDGQVIGHITDNRRIRNLMFKLHFMDYFDEGSFNNAQNILFGIMTFILSVSGLLLFINRLKNK